MLKETAQKKSKIIVLLNFPNNPTGYSITPQEAAAICAVLKEVASEGVNMVVVSDDAYFGLFYADEVMQESLFAHTANLDDGFWQ